MSLPTTGVAVNSGLLDARTKALKQRLNDSLDMNSSAEAQQQGSLRQSVGSRGGSLYDPSFGAAEQANVENRQQANQRSYGNYNALQADAEGEDAQRQYADQRQQQAWDREDRIRKEAWDREDRIAGRTGTPVSTGFNGGTYNPLENPAGNRYAYTYPGAQAEANQMQGNVQGVDSRSVWVNAVDQGNRAAANGYFGGGRIAQMAGSPGFTSNTTGLASDGISPDYEKAAQLEYNSAMRLEQERMANRDKQRDEQQRTMMRRYNDDVRRAELLKQNGNKAFMIHSPGFVQS